MTALTLLLLLSVLDEPQAKPAPPAAAAQDPDRPAIPVVELKALRDNNIFSPRAAKRSVRSAESRSRGTPPAPVKPKAPVVTGIYFDSRSQAHHAIVEDKNDSAHRLFKEPKFMKAGDEWAGIRLESVTQDKAVFNKGGTSREVQVGESLPEAEEKPLGAVDSAEEPVADDGETPPASASGSSPKNQFRGRTESKTMTPESQGRTLEEMKRRVKKNRPSDPEE